MIRFTYQVTKTLDVEATTEEDAEDILYELLEFAGRDGDFEITILELKTLGPDQEMLDNNDREGDS